ncbi:MAG: hypothetical protein K6F29_06680 [Bacteroidales bacterium]|nr:hypothetical protein [Bacteroidales bacterium]
MLLIGLLSVVFVGLVVLGSLRIRSAFAPHSLRIRSAFAPLNKKSFFRYSHLCSYTPPTDYVISNQIYTYEKIAFFVP